MIAIKVMLFFFALCATVLSIEEFVEKLIGHLKRSEEEYHILYTTGMISTIDFWPTLLSVLFWSGLYLLNQL